MDAQPAVGFPGNPAWPAELVPTSEFPAIRYKFSHFNPPQSEFFMRGRCGDANAVVAANTSAGKTVIAEMAIQDALDAGQCALYLSPLRALTSEKYGNWTDPNHSWSARRISIVTGDYQLTERRRAELDAAEIIAMTSEMLDSKVRKYRSERSAFLMRAGALVVDECFPFTTMVTLSDGSTLPIGLIVERRLPVRVLCVDHRTGTTVAKSVVGWHRKENRKALTRVSHEQGSLSMTPEHRVYTSNRGYVRASRLRSQDRLETITNGNEGHEVRPEEPYPAHGDGTQSHIGHSFGRRRTSVAATEPTSVGQPQDSALCGRRPSRVLEVQVLETDGSHSAQTRAKSRLQGGQQGSSLQYPVLSRVAELPEDSLSKWEKDHNPSMVEADRQPTCVGDLVLGRRHSDKGRLGQDRHAWLHKDQRSEIAPLAEIEMAPFYGSSKPKEEVLGIESTKTRPGQADALGSALRAKCLAEKGRPKERGIVLPDVRLTVHGGTQHSDTWPTRNPVQGSPLQEEMASHDPADNGQEVFVYDLTVEDIHNYFADGVLVHNCHLLGSEGRGAALENALMGFSRVNAHCRLILLSATIPNVRQIANWVGTLNGKDTVLIESDYRPCKLTVHFERFQDGYNYQQDQDELIRRAVHVVRMNRPDKFIAFVHTKKAGRDMKDALERSGLKVEFHSADLERGERQQIEEKFRGRELDVVVATSTLAMGLNLPARRVVVLGTKRGQQDVSWLDIRQMCGRAGRVGLDPQGDAHIVVPESRFLTSQEEYEHLPPVKSCLFDRDALAFHVIAEIDSGAIGSPKEMLLWHSRSLAHLQGQTLGLKDAEALLAELAKWGLVDTSRRPVETTSLGKVAALTYYSPFDIASWAMNFRKAFKDDPSDLVTAWALSDIPSVRRTGYVAADVAKEAFDLKNALYERGYDLPQGSLAAALAYLRLLRGDAERHSDSLSPVVRQCRGDAERIALALKLIDAKHGHWGRQTWFDEMALRVRYGVTPEAAVFCRLDGVGAVRAKALAAAGFQSVTDLLRDPGRVLGILKGKTGHSVLAQAARAVGGPPMS